MHQMSFSWKCYFISNMCEDAVKFVMNNLNLLTRYFDKMSHKNNTIKIIFGQIRLRGLQLPFTKLSLTKG